MVGPNYRSKESRIWVLHGNIKYGLITKFSQIYITIPKTTLWHKYLKIYGKRVKRYIENPGTIPVEHLERLAQLIDQPIEKFVELIQNELAPNN